MLKTFYLYHTNDLHSHFFHWPQISTFLKGAREYHERRGEAMLQFDIGDHLDRADPMTEGTSGQGNVQLLNELAYDAVTIGNNEGITLEKKDLQHLYDAASFPVLVANLFDAQKQRPRNMISYQIFSLTNGLTIAAIGITIPFSTFYESLGWQVVDPFKQLEPLIRKVREQADMVVLLSHMGLSFDQQMAREVDGIDIILGAHTHHLLEQGVDVNGTVISQCGKFGDYVGEMKVSFDTDKNQMISCDSRCVPIDGYAEDGHTKALLAKLTEDGQAYLREEVTVLRASLDVSWFDDSPFTKLLAQALKAWCQAEIGMVNAGVLLASLPKGSVAKADIHRVCPHPINPCTLAIRGDELKEIIRQSLTEQMMHLQIKGLGFRGKVMGRMVFDGVEIETTDHKNREVVVHGDPIDPGRYYNVATIDMFTLGPLFPGLSEKPVQYFLPEMLRDVLAWKLQNGAETR